MNNKKYIAGLIATALVTETITLWRANRVIDKQNQTIKDLNKAMQVADVLLTEPDTSAREEMQSFYRLQREFNRVTKDF